MARERLLTVRSSKRIFMRVVPIRTKALSIRQLNSDGFSFWSEPDQKFRCFGAVTDPINLTAWLML
jgi:hypothetical protein